MDLGVNVVDVVIGSMLMPPAIALLNQAKWNSQVKGLVALLVCALGALVTVFLRGPVNLVDWRNTVVVVAAAALVSYRVWWKPSGFAPALEAATSGRRARVVDAPVTEPSARASDAPPRQ